MDLAGTGALVAGGTSGLGAATARELARRGARVAILGRDEARGAAVAEEVGGIFERADVTSEDDLRRAVASALEQFGGLRLAVTSAGASWAERTVGKSGPASLEPFEHLLRVNLVGAFNVLRLGAAAIAESAPDEHGERGAIVMTASSAAYDGQIGQAGYAASKGGVIAMTLPAARDLAGLGIRVCTIAPGLFDTPMLGDLTDDARAAVGAQVPFPARLGRPEEYAQLACHIAENPMLNGEVIRLDGALRMPPK